MKFNEIRLGKMHESELGVFYKGLAHNYYDLKEVYFSEKEQKFAFFLEDIIKRKASFSEINDFGVSEDFLSNFRENIISVIDLNGLLEKISSLKLFVSLVESLIYLIKDIDFISNKSIFAETVFHNAIGLKQLSFFFIEKGFEELMINALNEVFVFHKEFGVCKTNLVLNEKSFNNLVQKIAFSVGKEFNYNNPLLDAHLPDGSRINATMNNISPKGVSLTIRKFSHNPLSIIDLIKNNTINVDAAAFLWVMVDGFGVNPKNILIVGGTATGKTAFLSVLSNFIRLNERIISIEDTLELNFLNRENWVALEAIHSKDNEISMNYLLKNSLRMRPDRIIVGEVRGSEALTLFTAMNNGHSGCLGTIHANNARETVDKLCEKPFDVPKSLLSLVDLIVVLQKNFSKEGVIRKVSQISEVSRMDDKILLANVFELNNSSLTRTNIPSHVIEKFAEQNSIEKNVLKKEIETRQLILSWMVENDFSKPEEILEVIQSYYFSPEKVLSTILGKN